MLARKGQHFFMGVREGSMDPNPWNVFLVIGGFLLTLHIGWETVKDMRREQVLGSKKSRLKDLCHSKSGREFLEHLVSFLLTKGPYAAFAGIVGAYLSLIAIVFNGGVLQTFLEILRDSGVLRAPNPSPAGP